MTISDCHFALSRKTYRTLPLSIYEGFIFATGEENIVDRDDVTENRIPDKKTTSGIENTGNNCSR